MTHYEAREQARQCSMVNREEWAKDLLGKAEAAGNHWLAFDLVEAARVVWGKSYCQVFAGLSKDALDHARVLQAGYSKEHFAADRG